MPLREYSDPKEPTKTNDKRRAPGTAKSGKISICPFLSGETADAGLSYFQTQVFLQEPAHPVI